VLYEKVMLFARMYNYVIKNMTFRKRTETTFQQKSHPFFACFGPKLGFSFTQRLCRANVFSEQPHMLVSSYAFAF